MFAVIKTGGKQYLVKEGESLKVEKLAGDVGSTIDFEVLLVSDEEGANVRVGKPLLSDKVVGTIAEHGRSKKVDVVKYKPKIRYKKRMGHRQAFTKVSIGKVA